MPQWAGSCWYYLRFCDPQNTQEPWNSEIENYWMPVDLYVGGAEHAVLHLLYSRFWHKVLYDLGLVSTKEPFHKLVNQGMILGEDGEKMSKSRGNVVNPDHVVKEYGADTLRLYEMFMGPLEKTKPWSINGVKGVYNFLNRVYRFMLDHSHYCEDALEEASNVKELHKLIKKVTEDIEGMRFNTAISQMMIFTNEFSGNKPLPREAAEKYVLLLAPFAPHLCEELWEILGKTNTLAYEPWPTFNEEFIKVSEVEVLVQVLGKPKARVMMPVDASEALMQEIALKQEAVQAALAGKPVRKVICVPGRLINIVA
jgi:leucyl-tRNA synthetase